MNNRILEQLKIFCNEMNNTNSVLDKKEVLKNHPEVKEILKWVYDPFIQFYITSANIKKNEQLTSQVVYTDIFKLLEDLSTRKETGHGAISICNRFIYDNNEYASLIYNIIDKDLKIRVGDKIINDIYPGLIPTFEVALANKFQDYKGNIYKEDWFVSRKIDGLRCITIIDEKGDISFYSRQGKEFETLDVLKKEIKSLGLKNTVFDGEVCIIDKDEKEDFQGIMKVIKKKDYQIENPAYLIFDMLDKEEFFTNTSEEVFSLRYAELEEFMHVHYKGKNLIILQQIKLTSPDLLSSMVQEAESKGWEGLMLRKDTLYKNGRSNDILKVKKMHSEEFKVVDIEVGPFRIIADGKEKTIETLSAVKIQLDENNIVSVGSGFTLEQRKDFYKDPSKILNKIIEVQYFEKTKNQNGGNSLRFPVFKVLHGDKREV